MGAFRTADSFQIAQFARDLVAIRLELSDDPCAAAAALVRETAAIAIKSRPGEADLVVSDASCGALQAVLAAGHDPARAASLIVAEVRELALERGLAPEAAVAYALEGFARLRRAMTQEQTLDVLDALAARFPGAGPAFAKALAAHSRHD